MVILLVFIASGPLFGQRAVQNLPFTYKEDFSAIPVCQTCTAPPNYFEWQNNVTIQGWHIENNGGHPTNSGLVFSPSEYNNTGIWSVRYDANGNKRIGGRPSNSNTFIYYGVRLVNNTTCNITRFELGYIKEQWTLAQEDNSDRRGLSVQYSLTANGNLRASQGNWTNINSLTSGNPRINTGNSGGSLVLPNPIDGNLTQNREFLPNGPNTRATVNLAQPWQPGQELFIRWVDPNNDGNDHSYYINDIDFFIPAPVEPGQLTVFGTEVCGPQSVTLQASGANTGVSYVWYENETGGTSVLSGTTATQLTTPVLTATKTYYVALLVNGCETARVPVTATINPIPNAPTTSGASICGSGVTTLVASGGISGNYRWYTQPTGGTAINGATDSSFQTPVLTTSTSYYVSIVEGNCESERVEVPVEITSQPITPTVTNAVVCGEGIATLTASGGTAGNYRWFTEQIGGNPIPDATEAIFQTPNLTTSTTYFVSVIDGTCESERVAVTATIRNLPSIVFSPQNTVLCPNDLENNTYAYSKSPDVATADVEVLIKGGRLITKTESSIVVSWDNEFSGTRSLQISVKNAQGCAVTSDEVLFKIDELFQNSACIKPELAIPNIFTPNGDGRNDTWNFANANLYGEFSVRVFNRYGNTIFSDENYKGNWSAEGIPNGTYFYTIEIRNENRVVKGWLDIAR